MGSIKPFSGPFGKPELIHLLRRTMFGVKKSDLNFFKTKNLDEVLQVLVPTTPKAPEPPLRAYYNNVDPTKDNLDTLVPFGKTWVDTPAQASQPANPSGSRRNSLKQWMTGLQLHQDRSVYEKMIMFYQTLLVTEDAVVENSHAMYNTQSLYRKYAMGNYKQLIKEITLDAGMLRYLNGERNTKSAPDENYGRELQELFCIGKGPGSGYTEDDVKAAAKVLTGWYVIYNEKINNVTTNVIPRKAFNKNNHDVNPKTFSAFYNNTVIKPNLTITDPAPFATIDERRAFDEIEQLITMIFATDELSKYICRRLWNYFVYYEITPEIESEVIEPLAELFRQYVDHPDQMYFVVNALLGSDYFFKSEHRGCMIKSPADFHIGMARTFDFPIPRQSTDPSKDYTNLEAQYYMWNIFRTYNVNAGQDVNDPPNVAGWAAYYQTPSFHEIWIDTATYPFRKGAYEAIGRSNFTLKVANTYDGKSGFLNKMNFVDFVKQFDNPSDPNELIREAVELMFGPPLSQSTKDQLKTNYLLLGQATDYYWTDAWDVYLANPSTTDPESKKVPQMLQDLFVYLMSAAEFHIC
jgi:uncharacterized protein (DUF1800 family)